MTKNRMIFSGSSSDVLYRTESNARDWWSTNKRAWKYIRWISLFAAILLVLGLIVYFIMIDLQVETKPASKIRETIFDGRIQTDGDIGVNLDGGIVLDLGGVTYREGHYRVTPGQPEPDPDAESSNGPSGQDFIEIVQAPDLGTSTVLFDGPSVDQRTASQTASTPTERNATHLTALGSRNSSAGIAGGAARDNSSAASTRTGEETDEIMMTSDRDIKHKFHLTNAHSRQPVHPTIPSSILKKTKEILGDPFAPQNETESLCFSTRLDMCKGVLPYDLTTLPLVPGISRVADLDAALPYFEMILQSGCSERARQFVCSLLEPECQPMGNNILPPCRKACKAVAEDCSDFMLATLDLSKVFHCNLYPDIEDPTQCVNFAKGDTCLPDEFRCSDGTCIPSRWECDNVSDCPLAGDETNCTFCGDEEFRCEQDRQCLPVKWQCDGNKDCVDGSDEFHCLQPAATSSGQPHTSPCPVGELRCVDGRCITMQQLCDSVHDCSDGADEGNCEHVPQHQ